MKRQLALLAKRGIDICGALFLLAVLGVPMLVVAVMIKAKLGPGPVIIRSPRIGQNAHTIFVYKFRSMTEARDETGKLLPDDQRMTAFSRKLRSSSLDECPQLFNILRGEMSLVGPRPHLIDFYPYLNTRELRRLEMPPGISGWAQINGRNSLNWDERLEMDVWYVENWSLALDIKIILRTIPVWVMAKDITAPGHATNPRLDELREKRVDLPANTNASALAETAANV